VTLSLDAERRGRRLARPLPSFPSRFFLSRLLSPRPAGTNVQRRTLGHRPATDPNTSKVVHAPEPPVHPSARPPRMPKTSRRLRK
jgi:hypothetical protein